MSRTSDETITVSGSYPLAETLSFLRVAADVHVEVGEGPARDKAKGVDVRLEMTSARAKQITCSTRGTILQIEDAYNGSFVSRGNVDLSISAGSSSISVSGSRIGSITINGSSVSFDGSSSRPEPAGKITVTVPKGTAIYITDPRGTSLLGDIEGTLLVVSHGCGDVRAGKTVSVGASLYGTVDLEIKELLGGTCKVESTGTGDFEVESGSATDLSLRTSGTGSMRFRGEAARADLQSSGTGDIRVKLVVGYLRERSNGTGTIRVKRRGP